MRGDLWPEVGDFLLAPLPFTDLIERSRRPALVVARPVGDDVILAFVTSRLTIFDERAEYLLQPDDSEFAATGLRLPSRIRLSRLSTLHRDLAVRRLGRAGPRTLRGVAACLRYVFNL